MKRGELARRTGCNLETIRYFETAGLLPAPPRTAGGHRRYDESHLRRLLFIRRARELGFSQAQVRGLLGLVDGESFTCDEVKAITLAHRAAVQEKIADLQRLDAALTAMVAECDRGAVPACPIIDNLSDAGGPPPVSGA